MSDNRLHPLLIWAQRKDKVFLTICLEDILDDHDLKLESNKMSFRGRGGHDKKEYGFEISFYKDIDPEMSKQNKTNRQFAFVLKKKNESEAYWPRLLESANKEKFIKTDFDKWRDEDDSDDEANNVDQNFEEMMRKMGDIPGNGGEVDDDTPASDDSDDDDIPELEKNDNVQDQ